MGVQTQVDVRVIAKDGKYLGDDIGGSLITIHDVHTGELLARGTTKGSSGVLNLMDISITRSEVLTVEDSSVFSAVLDLNEPRLIRVTAFGPLAAQQSANTVSLTQWIYPGKNITGGANGGGFLLEMPGLVVQIVNPQTHFLPAIAPDSIEIRANVTMMCGCPIGKGHPPWHPHLFDVKAIVTQDGGGVTELALEYDENAQYGAPSQFVNKWSVPKNTANQAQIYEIVVYAFQQKTGNTGVDKATLIIPPASSGAAEADSKS